MKSTAFLRLPDRFELNAFAYAHRGLWYNDGPTENSLEALLLASENGLGIEFDVRPAADGVPIIFHDPILDRMTDETGVVELRKSQDLEGLPLKGGGEIISLETLLSVWSGKTPLLCELKIDGSTNPKVFANTVFEMMNAARGPAAMMSFSTTAVAAMPKTIMRGQLIGPNDGDQSVDLSKVAKTQVDYLACHTSDARNSGLQNARKRLPLITWTVRSEAQCVELSSFTDSQIFEGFDPALAKRHILNK